MQHGDLRGEEVVVAEGDLVGRRRVVLVDHRHDAPVEQLAQRLARVEVVRARAHVEERQQHLRARARRARAAARRRRGRACPGRPRSPPAARRSRVGRIGSSSMAHPARDRAAGDDHDVVAGRVQRGDLVADARERVGAQLAVVVGDELDPSLIDDGSSWPRAER